MKIGQLSRGVLLGLLAFIQSSLLTPSFSFGVQFGIEVEFASENLIQPDESKIPSHFYEKPLEFVMAAMKDPQGKITLRKWGKRPARFIRSGVYTDPLGREWQVTPESVNTTGLDGFEFISPPLDREEDKEILKEILRGTMDTGLYGKGIRSSTHVTVDVSHLFSPEGDASQLINTILYIESHWLEIYAAVSPTRYGTIVNRFSVPLAAQHHELLKEMSELAPTARTYQNLKSLFEKYNQAEINMKEGSKDYAWKYRSANYRKLFQLDLPAMVPVIEFRILDYQKDPERTVSLSELFVRIIERAADLQATKEFVNPFPNQGNQFSRSVLNTIIYSAGEDQYKTFLSELGLDPKIYPRFKYLHTPPKLELPGMAIKQAYEAFDTRMPVLYEGKPITFGFETEMWGPLVKKVVPDINRSKVDVGQFTFLDGTVDKELTGNIEVRSIPTPVLADAISQMKNLATVLDGGIASFHLHMRVPMGLAQSVPQDQLQGWLSRISDTVYAWRLENRPHKYALRGSTQLRRPPHHLDKKGTVTVKTIEGTLDIELRGFMDDIDQYDRFAKLIIAGFHNPELIQGATDFQSLLHFQHKNLFETVSEFVLKYEQRPLTYEEIYLIEDLNEFATKNGILPLFGFEHAPYLSQLDQIRIQNANFEFKLNILNLLKDVTVTKKYQRQSEEFYKEFRWRIKEWAKSIHLYTLLEKTLLFLPMNSARIMEDPTFIRKLLLASANPQVDLAISQAAKRLLNRLPSETFFERVKESLYGTETVLQRNALHLLTEIAIDKNHDEITRRIKAAELVQKVIQDSLREESEVIPIL